MGYPVYDCDSRAKHIMDTDADLRRRIAEGVGEPAVLKEDGSIDRPVLSRVVFSDKSKLLTLNSLVHGAVKEDLQQWHQQHSLQGHRNTFVETAILFESGLDRLVSGIWQVTAPEEVRIERVCRRNGISAAEVKARINSQSTSIAPTFDGFVTTIINAPGHPLLPQILAAIAAIQQ